MPLTAKGVESAKPRPGAKVTKLSDGGGLQLWITPTGSKLWRLACRFGGKQKLVAIGAYPVISLKEARERRDEHRKVPERGRDPSVERKVATEDGIRTAMQGKQLPRLADAAILAESAARAAGWPPMLCMDALNALRSDATGSSRKMGLRNVSGRFCRRNRDAGPEPPKSCSGL